MELRQLITFQSIASTLNFTQTARLLNYAQSSVTAQIQALEEELGVPLFDRLGKRVALTEAGERLLRYAEKLLNLADEAGRVVPGGDVPAGTLTLSAPESLCAYRLPVILHQFREQFPYVRLVFHPLPATGLIRAVSEGMVDVSFVVAETAPVPGIQLEVMTPEPVLVVAAPHHALADSPVAPADLAREPFLLTQAGCPYRGLFERTLAADGIYLTDRIEFGSVEAIKQCARVGMGLAVLPAVALRDELARGQLVALNWRDENLRLYTQMAWHQDKWLSPALVAFLELCRTMMRTNEN